MPLQDICDVIAAHCDLKTHSKVTGICPPETIRLSTGARVTRGTCSPLPKSKEHERRTRRHTLLHILLIRHFEQLLYRWL